LNPKALERYRLRKGLSITDLSKIMGRTPGWYSRIKDGKQSLTAKHIAPMAKVFGVKPEKLAKDYFSDSQLEETESCDEVDSL